MAAFSRLAAPLLLLAAHAAHANGRLDPAFGQDGFAVEGFQPSVAGAQDDIAIAACSGPLGSLVVTGFASGQTRVVTIWLTPQGMLDTRFSDDGKASFDLPPGHRDTAVGLCQPDGKPVIAYTFSEVANDPGRRLRVLRIDAGTGQPDAAFAGGTVALDLNAYPDFRQQADEPVPLGLAMGLSGDLLLTGSYRVRTTARAKGVAPVRETQHGFIARLRGDGSVAAARSSNQLAVEITSFVAAGIGGDGRVRAVGNANDDRGEPDAIGRAILAYDTLTLMESGRWESGSERLHPWSGRMLDGDTMAVALVRNDTDPAVLMVEDALPSRLVPLPRPHLNGTPAQTGLMQLAPLGSDALVVAFAVRYPGDHPRELHVLKLRGTESGEPQLDPAFGEGGRTVIVAPPRPPCGAYVLAFARFTFWNGAIAAATTVDSSCNPLLDLDYAAVKLDAPLFADGLETRYPVR